MFLNALSAEDKPKFLSLLYIIAKSDGFVDEGEVAQIGAYAQEMGIEDGGDGLHTLEEIINQFKSGTDITKKIVFTEALALAQVHGLFEGDKKVLLENISEEFSLPKDFSNEVLDWVNTIRPLYAKGFQLVGLI